MLLLIGLIVLFVISLVVLKKADSDLLELSSGVSSVASGLLLIIALCMWPLNYYSVLGEIEGHYAIKRTIQTSRETATDIERAAMVTLIADWNKNLAQLKYWNETIFDIYIPDKVMALEELQ